MTQFLPDAGTVTKFCGAYEARGLKFSVVPVAFYEGYGLRMDFGPGSDGCPIFPLPAAEMQTAEAAEQWMGRVRDEYLSEFAFVLQER